MELVLLLAVVVFTILAVAAVSADGAVSVSVSGASAAGAFARQSVERGSRFAVRSVNGTPGILRLDDGKITAVVALEFRNDQVIAVRAVLNPAKLQHLGPIRP